MGIYLRWYSLLERQCWQVSTWASYFFFFLEYSFFHGPTIGRSHWHSLPVKGALASQDWELTEEASLHLPGTQGKVHSAIRFHQWFRGRHPSRRRTRSCGMFPKSRSSRYKINLNLEPRKHGVLINLSWPPFMMFSLHFPTFDHFQSPQNLLAQTAPCTISFFYWRPNLASMFCLLSRRAISTISCFL